MSLNNAIFTVITTICIISNSSIPTFGTDSLAPIGARESGVDEEMRLIIEETEDGINKYKVKLSPHYTVSQNSAKDDDPQNRKIITFGVAEILSKLLSIANLLDYISVEVMVTSTIKHIGMWGVRKGEKENSFVVVLYCPDFIKIHDTNKMDEKAERQFLIDLWKGKYNWDLDEEKIIIKLAHELAHIKLGHVEDLDEYKLLDEKVKIGREHQADYLSAEWLWKMGYCNIYSIMLKSIETILSGPIPDRKTHPETRERIRYINERMPSIAHHAQQYSRASFTQYAHAFEKRMPHQKNINYLAEKAVSQSI